VLKFPSVDTKDATKVAAFARGKFSAMYPGAGLHWLERVFADMDDLFSGRNRDYAAVDIRYHDFEHTLQATLCLVLLLAGRHKAGVEPKLNARQFELALSAVLLHDAGYIKLRSDTVGTGAKYTFCHVLRSCAFAASYLPTLGATDYEVEAVLGAINCTGPTKQVSRLHFREQVERIIGCALATADYLGQMAAPDYPEELGILFEEFQESDNFIHLPSSRRTFKSADDLINLTPVFWKQFVLPKLESDFQAVYRFLARPYPHGRNAYLDAVEKNIAKLKRRVASRRGAVRYAPPHAGRA
jgi:hypothetical protein